MGPFNISDGVVEKFDSLSFTEAFSRKMVLLGEKNPKVCAITAAMSKGTGLDSFARHYRERFFDVGIAEEHAVTFAGGLSAGGLIPVCAIYSTFIQRSVDQIIEDIALQKRHVVIALDRAGAVGADGETHQGIFDIALFRPVPNLTLMTVCSAKDLEVSLDWAIDEALGPVVLRWAKSSCPSEISVFSKPVIQGRGLLVYAEDVSPTLAVNFEEKAKDVLIVCTGGMYSESLTALRSLLLDGINTDIYVLRFIKPFDESYFISIASKYKAVVFVEDGVRAGGISESLVLLLRNNKKTSGVRTEVLAFSDSFVSNGSREEIFENVGLDAFSIHKKVLALVR